jgi:hypothetical protein
MSLSKLPWAVVSTGPTSDFETLLLQFEIPIQRISINDSTLDQLHQYHTLIILGDHYPNLPTEIDKLNQLIEVACKQEMPVFAEFIPVAGIFTSEILHPKFMRIVADNNNHPLLQGIPQFSLFETHRCYYLAPDTKNNINEANSFTTIAWFGKVTGANVAYLGFPNEKTPAFASKGKNSNQIYVATRISNYITMEYRLRQRWERLIFNIIKSLAGSTIKLYPKISSFKPYDGKTILLEKLTEYSDKSRDFLYLQTVKHGLEWFFNAKMFAGENAIKMDSGKQGVYEGLYTGFDPEGTKSIFLNTMGEAHLSQRADCTMDTMLCFSLAGYLKNLKVAQNNNTVISDDIKAWDQVGKNLLELAFKEWQYYDQSVCRGLFGWYNDSFDKYVFYGDDNGRSTLSLLLCAILSGESNPLLFDRAAAAINGLKFTQGKNGHRLFRIELRQFYLYGGRKGLRQKVTFFKPKLGAHYEAWSYAAMLYGGIIFDDSSLIQLISKGIHDYMKKFPDLPIEHSVNDDFSKLLIAVTYLYQATKEPRHLEYIQKILEFFLKVQDPVTGGIPEGDPFKRRHTREKTNKNYGTIEASVYSTPEDRITDQLYSTPFLAWAFYCVYKTGKFPQVKNALLKLLDYLSAIQIQSSNHQLNGAWMRAFDLIHGEYYGSNGDTGWGAYSIESGWMVAPTLTVFCMYLLDIDPFAAFPIGLQQRVKEIYSKEEQFQLSLEKDWQKYTPKPPNRLKIVDLP